MRKSINPVKTLRELTYGNIWHCGWARLNHFRDMPENKNRIWNYEAKIRTALKNASSGKTTVHPDSSYYWHRRQLLALNDVIFSVAHELYTCDESRTTEIAVILDELVERFYKEWNEFSSYLIPVEDQAQNGQVKE